MTTEDLIRGQFIWTHGKSQVSVKFRHFWDCRTESHFATEHGFHRCRTEPHKTSWQLLRETTLLWCTVNTNANIWRILLDHCSLACWENRFSLLGIL